MIWGTIVTSIIALVIAVPVVRHRAVPYRAVAEVAEATPRHHDRAARGGAEHRLRHVGSARVRADLSSTCSPAAEHSATSRCSERCFGPAARHRPACRRDHPRVHDHSVHRGGDAGRFRHDAGMLKESAYGVGATTWEVVWNVVLPYTKAASSAASCWASGARSEKRWR